MNDRTDNSIPSHSAARPRNPERGYILLVLAMFFALIAVGLMRVLPSALVETQREREEELIFRGQEYRRAIQAYVRKFGRYPTSLDELDDTNGVRFLRRRYLDPMKKKRPDENLLAEKPAAWQRSDEKAPEEVEEWRLIHIGPGGTFPDAKTSFNPPAQNLLAPPGGTGLPPSPGMTGGIRGASSPSGGFQTGPSSQQSPFGSTPTRLGGGAAERPASPQSPFGGSSSPFGAPTPPQGSGLGIGASPGPGSGPAQLPDALRPSADPSANPAQQPRAAAAGQPGSQVFGGGGIAGVASHSTDQSIKVVNGYTQYDEWEFVYDFRTDQLGMAAIARASGAVGQPGFAPGVPGQPPPGVMTAQPTPVPGGAPVPFPFPGSQPPGIRPGQPGFPGSAFPGSPAPGTQPTPSPFDPRPFPGSQPGQSPFGSRPSPGAQQPGMQQPGFQQPGFQQPGAQPGFPPSPIPGFPPNPQQRR
ncbi:MAG: hypothetical protein ACRD88_14680 [Terriglobia bacterium]